MNLKILDSKLGFSGDSKQIKLEEKMNLKIFGSKLGFSENSKFDVRKITGDEITWLSVTGRDGGSDGFISVNFECSGFRFFTGSQRCGDTSLCGFAGKGFFTGLLY